MCESSAGTVIAPFKLWSVCIPLEVRQPQAYARAQQGKTCDCAPVVPIEDNSFRYYSHRTSECQLGGFVFV
jgi:hypothetical protein